MTEPKRFQPNSIALTIAGSDPSGGAGIQADLKTFQQMGVYGASVVTLLTAQNTMGVRRVETMPPDLVIDQIDAVLDDLKPVAAKTGALGNAEIIEAVSERAESFTFPLIVDPVMVSKHGDTLISEDAIEAYRGLMKHAFLVTPNRYELAALTGSDLSSTESIAKAIHDLHMMGAKFVLAKMGEVDGSSEHILGSGQENLAIQSSRFDCVWRNGSPQDHQSSDPTGHYWHLQRPVDRSWTKSRRNAGIGERSYGIGTRRD